MISVLLNLLRLVSWPAIRSNLESVPCVPEKNLYSAVVGWSVLLMSVLDPVGLLCWSGLLFSFLLMVFLIALLSLLF